MFSRKKVNTWRLLLGGMGLLLSSFYWPQARPRLFLIGDSTCAAKRPAEAPETGWGMVLPELLTDGVKVVNRALNGRSTRSFRTQGHWQKIQEELRPGDFVLIQFGHNDQKESDTSRYAAPQTDYRSNLTRYVAETRAKGATPVLLTPVSRRKFSESGQFIDQHGEYPGVVRELARQLNVPLIDLHKTSMDELARQGPQASERMFLHFGGDYYPNLPKGKADNTHFSPYGAAVMAGLVADGLRGVETLRPFLKNSGFPEKYAYQLPQVAEPVFRKDTCLLYTSPSPRD